MKRVVPMGHVYGHGSRVAALAAHVQRHWREGGKCVGRYFTVGWGGHDSAGVQSCAVSKCKGHGEGVKEACLGQRFVKGVAVLRWPELQLCNGFQRGVRKSSERGFVCSEEDRRGACE